MTQDEQYHRENLHLTPSQRLGAVPLPDPIKPEHLSRRFRIDLDLKFGEEIDAAKAKNRYGEALNTYSGSNNIERMLFRYKTEMLEKFPDEITESKPCEDRQFITNLLRDGQYNEILDLSEWFLINASYMKAGIETVFANNPSAYKIGYAENNIPFIYPVNQASAEAVSKALDRLNSNNQTDILSKIREAATQLNNQEYLASAKFSMDAVEISGSQLAPNKNSFGQILSEIAKQKLLPNNEIRQILDKINAYANEHARHAKEDTPKIERDEAIYFFGLCAVTADYLASKQQPN